MLSDKEKLSLATSFRVLPKGAVVGDINSDTFAIDVVRKAPGKFALMWRGQTWTGENWEFSMLPSETSESFKQRSRFSLDEALELAVKMVEEVRVFNMTFPEWVKHWEGRRKP